MSSLVRQRQSLMFRSRSYMAFAITPQPPIVEWLADLDGSLERSEGFFAGHPVALDLSAVNLSATAIGHLVANLEERNIHILGMEGVDPAKWQVGLPPVLRGGRSARPADLPGLAARCRLSSGGYLCGPGCCLAHSAKAAVSIADDRRAGTLWAIRGFRRG